MKHQIIFFFVFPFWSFHTISFIHSTSQSATEPPNHPSIQSSVRSFRSLLIHITFPNSIFRIHNLHKMKKKKIPSEMLKINLVFFIKRSEKKHIILSPALNTRTTPFHHTYSPWIFICPFYLIKFELFIIRSVHLSLSSALQLSENGTRVAGELVKMWIKNETSKNNIEME